MSENNDLKEILQMIEEIRKGQKRLEKKVKKLQKDIINIQEDIYIYDEETDNEYEDVDDNDDDFYDEECEFEITCPYCGNEFIADENSKGKEKISCPKCHRVIELDWNTCDENCEHCHHHENASSDNLNVSQKDEDTYKNDDNKNNEDDM